MPRYRGRIYRVEGDDEVEIAHSEGEAWEFPKWLQQMARKLHQSEPPEWAMRGHPDLWGEVAA